ncbi:unnamed protein product, partial [Closterium sp. NIES-53]
GVCWYTRSPTLSLCASETSSSRRISPSASSPSTRTSATCIGRGHGSSRTGGASCCTQSDRTSTTATGSGAFGKLYSTRCRATRISMQ